MSRHAWLPTECAPRDYPAELTYFGVFPEGEARGLALPLRRTVANGWGAVGSTLLTGDPDKPLPERVELSWLSLAEGVHYGGSFSLPRSRLARLFAQGIDDPVEGRRGAWTKLAVGMAPGGDVVVWLTDGAFTRSVMGFQAAPEPLDWAQEEPGVDLAGYCRDGWARALPEARRAAVMGAKVPLGQWGRWRRRFGWTPSVFCPGTHRHLWIDSLNGEREIYAAPDWEDPWPDRAAPLALRASWETAGGEVRIAHVTFDPQESFEAFSRFAEARPADLGRIALEVEISDRFHDAAVTLRDSQIALPLENCKVEVFRQ
ncbi:DUF2931 family protein [Vannielia litorea]|uniref:DUF2931 family protein n=1 Tax=Vannielia litorea TaxID=1217970 RepID=UPI001BCADA19|nr:DUF2931 family protein [Vannielia litorea]MBS8226401.1 DUF2931 family protein [Vannielia litorea]